VEEKERKKGGGRERSAYSSFYEPGEKKGNLKKE